jgi:TRAP-type C4-dicarboxylate transport system substrate-binding protein
VQGLDRHERSKRSAGRAALGRLLLASVAFGAAVAIAQTPVEPPKQWRLSTAVGTAFALGKAGERWAELAGENSGGALTIVAHPGASLAGRDPAREFTALRDGAADLAVGSSFYWSLQVPALNVVGLPWIAPGPRELSALVASERIQADLMAAVRAAGVEPLALAPLGHREIASVAVAVRAPEDLNGKSVRVTSTPYLVDFYAALGARPQTLPFADALTAFKSGRLDAQDGTLASFAAARLDVAGVRHVTLWGAVAEVAVFAVNRGVWDRWRDVARAPVAAAARQAAAELADLVRAENDAALAGLAQRGVEILRLTATGRAPFAAAARPIYDKWAGAAGEDLTRRAEAAVDAAR